MSSLGYNSGLQLSDYLVCHAPEELRGVPVRELAEDDFGCKSKHPHSYHLSILTRHKTCLSECYNLTDQVIKSMLMQFV